MSTIELSLVLLTLLLSIALARKTLAHNQSERDLAAAAQRALAQTGKLEVIITGMPDGIMVVDPALRLLEWNARFSDFTGVPAELLTAGLSLEDILRSQAQAGEFGAVDVETEVARRLSSVRSGASSGTIERLRPNGRTMELRRSPLPGGGFVTLYTDITGRRQAENQLRQAQKMEAIGHLTSGMAHDFNNLLTVISGNLELARRSMENSDLLRTQRHIETAQAGAQRAATLTKRLLAFARQQQLSPELLDTNKVVSGISEMIRHSIGSSIELETVLAGGLWDAYVDLNQLENALLNLAINAKDAMPSGGKLTIETGNAHLDAAYAAAHVEVTAGQYVVIAVSDGGSGMAPEHASRAFEPFFTTKEIGKGTGLGLAQVFGFIKQSNGHVKIYSEVGVGTTVKLYLPRHVADEIAFSETEQPKPEPPRAQAAECVLIVEDDPDVLSYSIDAFETLGYHVLGAKDSASALLTLESRPDVKLLFTDIELPGLNGPELAEQVKLLRPGLGVLYTTGYSSNAVVHRNILDRHIRSLNKPFTLSELAMAAREAIDSSAPADGNQTQVHAAPS